MHCDGVHILPIKPVPPSPSIREWPNGTAVMALTKIVDNDPRNFKHSNKGGGKVGRPGNILEFSCQKVSSRGTMLVE